MEQLAVGRSGFLEQHRSIMQIVPVYLIAIGLLIIGQVIHPGFVSVPNIGQILLLSTFIAVVSYGQGIVVLTGGFDLSVAWVMTMGGIMLTSMSQGSNISAIWVIPVVLGTGLAIGMVNGLGIVLFDIAPIVMTLAVNTIIQGVVMTAIQGTPGGSSPPFLSYLTNANLVFGIPWLAVILFIFAILGILLLNFTSFGRYVYAVGNSPLAARLSGVNVNRTLVWVYGISGLCAALAGILAAAYTQTAFLGTGDSYQLPSLAAVVVGGASIFGGRGQYAATAGGAILLTILSAILASLNWPDAVRTIAYGVVILITVVAMRQK